MAFNARVTLGSPVLVQDIPCWALKIPNEVLCMIANDVSIADVNSLVQTCRSMAASLQSTLLQRDIQSQQYDSLFWACYSGCHKLARACLDLGASPDAAFCKHAPPDHPLGSRQLVTGLNRNLQPKRVDSRHFKIPVFPHQRFHRKGLFRDTACSALALATERNHLNVIQVLLEFGADTTEKHHAQETQSDARGLYHFPHHSVISHVCSVPAAKILLEAGAKEHINDLSKALLTPLEMVLYRWDYKNQGERNGTTDPELYGLIQFLLQNGASPRRISRATIISPFGPGDDYRSSPLLATIPLRSLSLFNLIFDSSLDDETDDFQVLQLALGYQSLLDTPIHALKISSQARKTQSKINEWHFRNGLLVALLKAGVSPSQRLEGRPWFHKSLLAAAIENSFDKGVETLMTWKADGASIRARRMSAISEVVLSTDPTWVWRKSTDEPQRNQEIYPIIPRLVALGADINRPSFCPQGFPPLLFAACDRINVPVFETLLRSGAKVPGFFQLVPNGPSTCLLQCLFRGKPWVRTENCMGVRDYRLDDLEHEFSRTRSPPVGFDDIRTHRSRKFDACIKKPVDASVFHTSDGKHILNWALEELECSDLSVAVDKLLPYFAETQLSPSLDESPLLALFAQPRRENYLAFGTLDDTFRIVQAMVNSGISASAEVAGETVLHRVCKLSPRLGSRSQFDQIVVYGSDTEFDFSKSFLKNIRHCCYFNKFDASQVCFQDLESLCQTYNELRMKNIMKIMWFLAQKGADFTAQDSDGKTPIDYAEENEFDLSLAV